MMLSAVINRQGEQETRRQSGSIISLSPSLLVSLLGWYLESITDATNRLDVDRTARIRLNLFAQPADMHIDGAAVAQEIVAPNPFQQHIARKRHTTVADQARQQVKLFLRKC